MRFLSCLLILLSGCATTAPAPDSVPSTSLQAGALPNYSGHWEKNYGRSDDFNNKFQLFILDLRRRAASSQNGIQQQYALPASEDAVMGLVRLTQEITDVPVLEILQETGRVQVLRDGDYTLDCAYGSGRRVDSATAFGQEACGWNGEQLIFSTHLQAGLSIVHQLTLNQDASELNITSTVSSDAVPNALTISTYYQRYDPPEDPYFCTFTLSQLKVCEYEGP